MSKSPVRRTVPRAPLAVAVGAARDAIRENGVAGLSPRQILAVVGGCLLAAIMLFLLVYTVVTLAGGTPLL